MSQPASASFFHIGLCAADLDRTIRFYIDALDFEVSHYVDPGPEFASLAKGDGGKARAWFLKRGDLMLEILAADAPGAPEGGPKKPAGLHHVSFVTDDVEALAERIVRAGGRIATPKLDTPDGDLMFCADPDGLRIELWNRKTQGPAAGRGQEER